MNKEQENKQHNNHSLSLTPQYLLTTWEVSDVIIELAVTSQLQKEQWNGGDTNPGQRLDREHDLSIDLILKMKVPVIQKSQNLFNTTVIKLIGGGFLNMFCPYLDSGSY